MAILLLGVAAGILAVGWYHWRGPRGPEGSAEVRPDVRTLLSRLQERIESVLRDNRKDFIQSGPILGWIVPQTGKRVDDGLEHDPWGRPWIVEYPKPSILRIGSLGADGKPGGTGDDEDVTLVISVTDEGFVATIEDNKSKR